MVKTTGGQTVNYVYDLGGRQVAGCPTFRDVREVGFHEIRLHGILILSFLNLTLSSAVVVSDS